MSVQAEMERELIVERTRAEFFAARSKCRVGGLRQIMMRKVIEPGKILDRGATLQQLADVVGVRMRSIYNYLQAE